MQGLKALIYCCHWPSALITKHISICSKLSHGAKLSHGTEVSVRQQQLEKVHNLLKSEKKPAGVYILDQELADNVAGKVTDKLEPDSTVLECSPGAGLLTGHLLNSAVHKVIAAEPKEEFLPYLKKLQKVHGKLRLDIEHVNVFKYTKTLSDQDAYYGILGKLKNRPWEADPPLSVFGVVPSYREGAFLRNILLQIATRMGFYSIGRTQFFLFMSPRDYKLMHIGFPTKDHRLHHRFSILFQLLFDFECLLQVDKSQFTPPFPRSTRKRIFVSKLMDDVVDPTMMYLVHLKPKKDIHKNICSAIELPKFAAFLKQVTRNKSLRVIPKMESWVPGCGVQLILMNYTMLHKFQDLVPNDYVQIYQEMVKWPEYQESSLQMLLEKETALLLEEDFEQSTGKGSDSPEHVETVINPVGESDDQKRVGDKIL